MSKRYLIIFLVAFSLLFTVSLSSVVYSDMQSCSSCGCDGPYRFGGDGTTVGCGDADSECSMTCNINTCGADCRRDSDCGPGWCWTGQNCQCVCGLNAVSKSDGTCKCKSGFVQSGNDCVPDCDGQGDSCSGAPNQGSCCDNFFCHSDNKCYDFRQVCIGGIETDDCRGTGCGTRTCKNDGSGFGPCTGDTSKSTSCRTCGDKACQSDGTWSSCQGDGSTQSCGDCGTRTCLNDGSGYGSCKGQGVCSPGSSDSQSCGLGGTETRTCSSSCSWGSFGSCTGEGSCSPGATQSQGCGNCGSQTRTCQSNFEWGSYGSCTGQGECSAGSTGTCGLGGTRTCSSSCNWGSCGGEGVCSPGSTQGCGNCGSQTCQSNFQWGSCSGEGCTPGSTQCSSNRFQTCTGSCSWSNSGTDVDSDGVDQQCEDGVSCDIPTGAGVCQTAVAGKCVASTGEDTIATCSDGLDNDCDGAIDGDDTGCSGTFIGTVTAQETGNGIQAAKVSILDSGFNEIDFDFTIVDGTYSITVQAGTYTVLASHSDYVSQGVPDQVLNPLATLTVDFTLVLGTTCEADCTYAGDNTIHSSCSGKNGCEFIDATAEAACDLAQPGWERVYDADNYIVCSGSPIGALKPKTETEATVTCEEENLVKLTKIVIYKGQPVNLVITVCG